ncbi:aldo/keto reductase [Halocalculus aciditolerans]|uniref:Aldehyde oxidoreductase n=1 Tax=Halocalculus aciditolerans TaxID=1383812 RepID=A0A830FGP0_9EURY|nr:aldo/keto reductase [Halocalculus aciditolerans]GGL53937.1 aldehyde oxidoreductase [Halocalculus aciditolerans]
MARIHDLGLGTYQNTDPDECADAVSTALDVGYRHVDTAQMYDNEAAVGRGIAESTVPREDVFLATKLDTDNLAYDDVIESTAASLDRLGVDSVDLLYVHWPLDSYDPEETLAALDDLRDDGVIDHVGLSNFTLDLLDEARDHLDSPIFAHQVEMHPLLQQEELREYARTHDHHLVAYCPIARNQVEGVPELEAVARKHGATEAQVALAWLREKNVTAIPKASSEAHIRENYESLDIDLDADDVDEIDGIEAEERIVDFDGTPW